MQLPFRRYDLVMCRNTVIYFNEETRDALHRRLVEALATGGHLVIGSSERIADPRGLGLEPTHRCIYRKR
jgi:chemotaxis protein methyltransferase CheR